MLKSLQSQEYALGSYLRQNYLNPASPSYIQGINPDVADIDQLYVRADAGGGNVILDSAYALLQGLYPPTPASNITLADGQLVESPLGGYQYIPVESLEDWQAPSLTSWMDCEVSLGECAAAQSDSALLVLPIPSVSFKQRCRVFECGCASGSFPSSC